MQYKSIVLIDGENLVFRYQEMIKAGYKPVAENIHIPDSFVWNEDALNMFSNDIVRASYYTTVVGDDTKVDSITDTISKTKYNFSSIAKEQYTGTLVPHIFKKNSKQTKTKSVDINLTIDTLRYSYGNSIDKIIILSGDGDYIPLLREVMSKGKMIQVYAFSSGLNKNIICNVDDLVLIDSLFFEI